VGFCCILESVVGRGRGEVKAMLCARHDEAAGVGEMCGL
jgi:hypothetical protein